MDEICQLEGTPPFQYSEQFSHLWKQVWLQFSLFCCWKQRISDGFLLLDIVKHKTEFRKYTLKLPDFRRWRLNHGDSYQSINTCTANTSVSRNLWFFFCGTLYVFSYIFKLWLDCSTSCGVFFFFFWLQVAFDWRLNSPGTPHLSVPLFKNISLLLSSQYIKKKKEKISLMICIPLR